MINLILGDCLEQMKKLKSNSVDSICCDPPYGISFTGIELDPDYYEICKARVQP